MTETAVKTSSISTNIGFWGYAHLDDQADGGRVTRLAEKIRLEYQALTTRNLEIFVDRRSLAWGDQWRLRIEESLQVTTFYIPIITPNFIESKECRKEFLNFVATAKSLGVEEYILAIRYIPVPDLDEESTDKVKALVAATQYEDWQSLRFEEEDSAIYRRAVNKLALRLKDLTEQVEARPTSDPVENVTRDSLALIEQDEDAPGLFDLIGEFEPAADQWMQTVHSFPPLLEEFSAVLASGTAALTNADGSSKPFAHRIPIMRKLAVDLEPSSNALEEAGRNYSANLIAIDPAVRALIELSQLAEPGTENWEASVKTFQSIIKMVEASAQTSVVVADVAATARKYQNLSRDLRPAIKRFDAGMRSISDGHAVVEEWTRLIDETGMLPL